MKLIRVIPLLFICVLLSCTTTEVVNKKGVTEIKKSPNDTREYRTLTLPNQLQVVLISDPNIEVSGASLSVAVGSYQNPKAFPGLAHYLEHMLFLGTKKYPKPNSFQSFVQENAGFSNAYTATDHTNYYFQVDQNAYADALDRYSDYFKSPTLDKEYSDKERNAVDSEWSMGKSQDNRIINRLRGVTANPNHPSSRISVGNLDTLVDQEDQSLYEAMTEFYQRYYSANNMNLVLFGKQDVEQLQQLAEQYFSDIDNHQIEKPSVNVQGLTEAQTGVHIYYRPQKPLREMIIEFPLADNSEQWKVKPNQYIANLLSSEEPGTAAQQLREKGWVDNFTTAANPAYYGSDGIFTVNISLTEKGLNHQDDIIATVFDYLELIKEEGVDPVYYQEYKAILAKQYADMQIPNALNQAIHFSSFMFKVAPEHLNDAPYTFEKFDVAAVKQVLQQLTPERARVWHINPTVDADTTIPFYKGQYRVSPFTQQELQHWNSGVFTKTLSLPQENDLFSSDNSNVVAVTITTPEQVVAQDGLEAWLAHSQYHQSEQGYLQVMFNTPLAQKSAKNRVMSDLINRVFSHQTTALRDKAGRAGIGIGIERPRNNHALTLSGYSEKHFILYQRLLKKWLALAVNPQQFTVAKEGLKDWLNGRAKEEANRQLFTELDRIMVSPNWTDEELLTALDDVTVADLNQYHKALLSNNRVRIFAFGNYTKAAVQAIAEVTDELMPSNWEKLDRYIQQQKIPPVGDEVVFAKDINKSDSGLLKAYYSPLDNLTTAARLFLLNSVFYQEFYNQLRTEEQIGYVVGSSIDRVGDYWGFIQYAQTKNTRLDKLSKRFDRFLVDYLSVLNHLDSAVVEQLRQSVIAQINQPAGNFYDEYPRILNDFYRGNDKFDTRTRLLEAIEKTTKEDLVEEYESLLINGRAYKVEVLLQGTTTAEQ